MAYYGAQVIHPKTIKPLQNKNIPLYVKSFIHPKEVGTIIHNETVNHLPPIIVYKENQALVQISTKDFSFTDEGLTTSIYDLFAKIKYKQNLTQITAISLLCVVDDHPEKLEKFALAASQSYDVQVSKNLTLLTIRHHQQQIKDELTKEKSILLLQQTPEIFQVLMKASG